MRVLVISYQLFRILYLFNSVRLHTLNNLNLKMSLAELEKRKTELQQNLNEIND